MTTNKVVRQRGLAFQADATLSLRFKWLGLLEDTLVIWGGEFGRTTVGENPDKVG